MKITSKLIITAAVLLGFSSASIAAWADDNTSEVRLIATIDNGPAFEPVRWKIFRTGQPNVNPIEVKRHAFTMRSVKPGRYTAIVHRGNETRRRDFYVMADTTSNVHIAVD